jgi:hypothetical protein
MWAIRRFGAIGQGHRCDSPRRGAETHGQSMTGCARQCGELAAQFPTRLVLTRFSDGAVVILEEGGEVSEVSIHVISKYYFFL